MALTLGESQVVNEIADALYPFLPGKPHPMADPAISFRGVARDVGLRTLWVDGSKLPALSELLAGAFSRGRQPFATLLQEIVRRGLIYREGKNPVSRQEIEHLNELLLKLGLRIKQLADPVFLERLPSIPRRSSAKTERGARAASDTADPTVLRTLQKILRDLTILPPVDRGFAFERLLGGLFEIFGLAPRSSFRLVGEQIDGSFVHHGDHYLVEARWRGEKARQSDLLAFSGKVAGKAQWARGLFVSISGFSDDGLEAFARGKQTNIICFDGLDLDYVLDRKVHLPDLIDRKARRAAESNSAFVPSRVLYPHLV
jgi:hypothetical protein